MKKSVFILLLVAFASLNVNATNTSNSKNPITQTRKTASYNTISVLGSLKVNLVYGTEGEITVTADADIIDLIETDVTKNDLVIKLKSKTTIKNNKAIKITVPVSDINILTLNGSGDITSNYTLKDENLAITLMGSGDINLNVENKKIVTTLTGSGDIVLKGKTQVLEAYVNGSGEITSEDLKTERSTLVVNGSGDISSNTTKNVNASVIGSGDIKVTGNPKEVQKKVNGSGSIVIK